MPVAAQHKDILVLKLRVVNPLGLVSMFSSLSESRPGTRPPRLVHRMTVIRFTLRKAQPWRKRLPVTSRNLQSTFRTTARFHRAEMEVSTSRTDTCLRPSSKYRPTGLRAPAEPNNRRNGRQPHRCHRSRRPLETTSENSRPAPDANGPGPERPSAHIRTGIFLSTKKNVHAPRTCPE